MYSAWSFSWPPLAKKKKRERERKEEQPRTIFKMWSVEAGGAGFGSWFSLTWGILLKASTPRSFHLYDD